MAEPVEISKTRAAEEQLAVAIHLFFAGRSTVAVHTLAGACHRLLCDLALYNGLDPILTGRDWTSDREKAEWLRFLRRPQNFLKHAERDPDDKLDFRPNLTPFMLVDCIYILLNLTRRLPLCAVFFFEWFLLQHPALDLDPKTRPMRNALRAEGAAEVSLEIMAQVLEKEDPSWSEMVEYPSWRG